jgi:putative transposase
MTRPRHEHDDLNKIFFVTTNTFGRFLAFSNPLFAQIAMDAIFHGRYAGWYYLFGFVIMPDHMHLLFRPNVKNVARTMQGLKGFTSRTVNRHLNACGPLWQEGYIDFPIYTRKMAEQKLAYIEQNPIRAGLVKEASDYPYSSAGKKEGLDILQV